MSLTLPLVASQFSPATQTELEPYWWMIVPPQLLSIVGFLAIGWMCGAGLMLACAGMGWLMAKWLGLSFYEGYLAASPAVVALQVIRLIMVILFAGWLPKILSGGAPRS